MIRTIGIRREIMTDVYSDGYCADAAWPSPSYRCMFIGRRIRDTMAHDTFDSGLL